MAAETFTLAENGTARAVIVVASDAPAPERHAADELARFLGEVTGGQMRIVHQPPQAGAALMVGQTAACWADAGFTADGLGSEGIVIRTVGNRLILAGGRPRGTLYAVYTFLEDYVGCRWWTSAVSHIPRRPTLAVEPVDVRYVPPLEYRESFWFDAFDGDWAVRNKCNGTHARLDEQRGGKKVYEGFVHTFYQLIPPDKYFAEHPEWFSLVKGKRTHQVMAKPGETEIPMPAQLCLTNEEMRAELVKNLKARLRADPQAAIASVSQNDEYPGYDGRCECDKCRALEEEEGSPAGPLLHFVNAVAAEVEKEFPQVAISTLAYHYTRKPPRHVRPRPNVIVRLCTIECSFSVPLTDPRNQAFQDDMRAWAKICDRLYVWDYVGNFAYSICPHPNLRVLAPNIRFFVKNHARGVFDEGIYQTEHGEMAELKAWVLAKLLWNPQLDGAKLIDEFVNGYYGPAGRYVRDYLKLIHDQVEAAGDYLDCWSPPTARFLSLETLTEGWGDLQAAENAVKDQPELRLRVQSAQLPVRYVFLMRWDELRAAAATAGVAWPMPQSPEQAYKEFRAIADALHVTHLREGTAGFDSLEQAVRRAQQQQ